MGRTAPQTKSSAGWGVLGVGVCLLLSAVLLMVAWNWSRAVAVADGLPQIAASDGPFRIAPEDPGGEAVPYVGMEVYSLIETPGRPSTSKVSPQASPVSPTVTAPPPQRAAAVPEADGATVVSQAESAQVAADGIYVPVPRPGQRSR